MVEEGLFDKFPVDAVFGMHNWPGLPVGQFAVRPGPMMAAFELPRASSCDRRDHRHASCRGCLIYERNYFVQTLTTWRRDLHAQPQTAFEETYASDFIAARLQEAGIQVNRGLAKTGVVGTLQGSKTSQSSAIVGPGLTAN